MRTGTGSASGTVVTGDGEPVSRIPDPARCPAVVVGLSPTGLAVARSLGRLGVPVFGVSASRYALGRASRYCSFLGHLSDLSRAGEGAALREGLVEWAQRSGDRPVLYVTDDRHIEILDGEFEALSQWYRLSTDYRVSGLSVLDKRSFYTLCEKHGVEFPATYWPTSDSDVRRISAEVRYPALLKPALPHHFYGSIGPKKVVTVDTAKELVEAYRRTSRSEGDLLVQEIIPGPDDRIWISVIYVGRDSKPRVVFVGRKLRQYPPHFGSASLAESRYNREVEEVSSRFLGELGYRGIASLEFKEDPRDGGLKMIEVNARLILTGALCAAAGIDVVGASYLDLTGQGSPPASQVDGVRWSFMAQDLRSAVRMWKARELSPLAWLASIRGIRSEAVFARDDWAPALSLPLFALLSLVRKWSH